MKDVDFRFVDGVFDVDCLWFVIVQEDYWFVMLQFYGEVKNEIVVVNL